MSGDDDRPPRPADDQPADDAALVTAATPDGFDDGADSGLDVLLPAVGRMTSRMGRIRALQTQVVPAIRLERTLAVHGCCCNVLKTPS